MYSTENEIVKLQIQSYDKAYKNKYHYEKQNFNIDIFFLDFWNDRLYEVW